MDDILQQPDWIERYEHAWRTKDMALVLAMWYSDQESMEERFSSTEPRHCLGKSPEVAMYPQHHPQHSTHTIVNPH